MSNDYLWVQLSANYNKQFQQKFYCQRYDKTSVNIAAHHYKSWPFVIPFNLLIKYYASLYLNKGMSVWDGILQQTDGFNTSTRKW